MIPVTVVIPVHNMANTLGRAIESALDAAEIIVVDDTSTDNSGWLAIEYENKDLVHIKALSNLGCLLPCGVVYSRNRAIARADYDLIVPLDADDTLLPGALQAMYDAWQDGTLVYGGWMQDGVEYQAPPIDFITRKNVCHATMLFSKADWRRVGGYPIRYNVGEEDYAFHLMLHKAGVKSIRLEQPLYVRNINSNGRTAQVEKYHNVIREMLKIDNLI